MHVGFRFSLVIETIQFSGCDFYVVVFGSGNYILEQKRMLMSFLLIDFVFPLFFGLIIFSPLIEDLRY